eukprot:2152698-Prymnesium_polylepis.1
MGFGFCGSGRSTVLSRAYKTSAVEPEVRSTLLHVYFFSPPTRSSQKEIARKLLNVGARQDGPACYMYCAKRCSQSASWTGACPDRVVAQPRQHVLNGLPRGVRPGAQLRPQLNLHKAAAGPGGPGGGGCGGCGCGGCGCGGCGGCGGCSGCGGCGCCCGGGCCGGGPGN